MTASVSRETRPRASAHPPLSSSSTVRGSRLTAERPDVDAVRTSGGFVRRPALGTPSAGGGIPGGRTAPAPGDLGRAAGGLGARRSRGFPGSWLAASALRCRPPAPAHLAPDWGPPAAPSGVGAVDRVRNRRSGALGQDLESGTLANRASSALIAPPSMPPPSSPRLVRISDSRTALPVAATVGTGTLSRYTPAGDESASHTPQSMRPIRMIESQVEAGLLARRCADDRGHACGTGRGRSRAPAGPGRPSWGRPIVRECAGSNGSRRSVLRSTFGLSSAPTPMKAGPTQRCRGMARLARGRLVAAAAPVVRPKRPRVLSCIAPRWDADITGTTRRVVRVRHHATDTATFQRREASSVDPCSTSWAPRFASPITGPAGAHRGGPHDDPLGPQGTSASRRVFSGAGHRAARRSSPVTVSAATCARGQRTSSVPVNGSGRAIRAGHASQPARPRGRKIRQCCRLRPPSSRLPHRRFHVKHGWVGSVGAVPRSGGRCRGARS